MSSSTRFAGKRGSYLLPTASALPHAVGRASLIYQGVTPTNNQPVCIKVYASLSTGVQRVTVGWQSSGAQSADSNFEHELRAYAQLEHPNILPLLDYGREDTSGALFLVLPWCEGGDLRNAMKGHQFFPLSDAIPILRGVAQALDYAHSRGFVHGDVKPENILFSHDPARPFLSDFGSARRAAYVEQVTTEAGGPGTTAYLSPEQIGDARTTARSDVYAFGTVAYEMLTARLPVDGRDTPYNQMAAKLNGQLLHARVANPSLPSHVADALMKALAVTPADRPESALLLCQMLTGEVKVKPATPTSAKSLRRPLTRSQRVALLTTIITVIGAIIVAAVNIIPGLRGHESTQDSTAKRK